MADCGAGGTTLDRAARAIAGGGRTSQSDGGKHLASWLGRMAVITDPMQRQQGAMHTSAMPIVAPDHLVLPSVSTSQRSNHSAVVASDGRLKSSIAPSTQQPFMTSPQHHPQYQPHPHPLSHQQQQHIPTMHPMMMQHQPHHQYQHHQQAMAAMAHQQQQQQQQHFMMMQQQQQQLHFMRLQQQQQIALQQQKASNVGTLVEDNRVHHEDDEGYRGHDGIVRPAGIEELAAAWADAQAEYEELEAAANLAAAYNSNEDEIRTYEFTYKVNDEEKTNNNPTTDRDWLEEGRKHFREGNLPEAIRALEHELQLYDPDNAAAWSLLGRCHAENDQDPLAIVCLEHAVDRDPYAPDVRLALGVSYVNELNHGAALDHLRAWITHNPTFAGISQSPIDDLYGATDNATTTGSNGMESAFDEVQRLLLQVLGMNNGADDASVLEALGVVYNVSRDYDAAIDAFTKAIALQPENYQLYNRLGATLANCNQSEKALPMYGRALELRPRYARAWLNSAISHSNLHDYNEAARCYLQTLSLNPSAMHCWSYLRIALSSAEKWDLIPLAAAMDLPAFQEHFNFVLYPQDLGVPEH